jgi:ABC-type sugar transport system ATPase subunit
MNDAQRRPLLEAAAISKRFGAIRALDDVSLRVGVGEVHGLLGANGAGKSTLIGILSGAVKPDSGAVRVADKVVSLGSVSAARAAGLAVVHQELMLFPDRTVEENVFASVLPSGAFRWTTAAARRDRVEATMDRLGAVIDPKARVGELPLAHRQLVEIARALCSGGRVLVLDEPTSALSKPEARGLFDAIRAIAAQDAAVIFVSHRLDEVFEITDALTVLRDGRVVGRWRTAEADIPTITRAMVGELADERPPAAAAAAGRRAVAIRVRSSAPGVPELDLSLRAGEVVGLAGLEGSGVSRVLEMLGGIVAVSGVIEIDGRRVKFRHPSEAIREGVVYMPPDRKKDGLWLEQDASFNIGSALVARLPPAWLHKETLDRVAEGRIVEVGVRTNALHDAVGRLSGGNQQRVLLARSLEARPRVLLLNDFTRGVDVKAKAGIHALVRKLAGAGISVCVTSSDLEELLGVADRIVCMRLGRIVADAPSSHFDKLSILALASTAPARRPDDQEARLLQH